MLVNGAPGIGKSTLARRYAAEHPMTLALDVDIVRSLLGGWLDAPTDAGLLARQLALAMARTQLGAGHDVIVPQYLGRLDFVVALDRTCAEAGVEFVETALVSEPEDVARRLATRSASSDAEQHRQAAALLERTGEDVVAMYLRMLEVIAQRPATRVVRSVEGDVDGTYARLLAGITG